MVIVLVKKMLREFVGREGGMFCVRRCLEGGGLRAGTQGEILVVQVSDNPTFGKPGPWELAKKRSGKQMGVCEGFSSKRSPIKRSPIRGQ
jgi:hypothetical protein